MKAIFEINTITGLRYIELQRLYENPQWYYKDRNEILSPKEAQKKEKQKLPKRIIDKLPTTFSYVFSHFINSKKPTYRSSWNKDLARWSDKAGISPKVRPKTPRKTIESWILKSGIP